MGASRVAQRVNDIWSMDFVSDCLVNGRRIKCLTVTDDFSRECVNIGVDYGIGGQYVTRLLDQAAAFRGYSSAVRTDNGPEFTGRAFIAWTQTHGIHHLLIEPGKPMQNAYIESFNGKFRDECLNEHGFENLIQARTTITAWRQNYNEIRPHSSAEECPLLPLLRGSSNHLGRHNNPFFKKGLNLRAGFLFIQWYGQRGQVSGSRQTPHALLPIHALTRI